MKTNIEHRTPNIECRRKKGDFGMVRNPEQGQRAYDLEDRLIDFSVRIMNIVEALPNTRVGNHVGGQLLRCGTAPASNYGEAQSAESRTDFVHKMKIALKDLRETRIWLRTALRKPLLKPAELTDVLAECNELTAIFVASIRTAQKNRRLAAPSR
jgi:four helix bundle protein